MFGGSPILSAPPAFFQAMPAPSYPPTNYAPRPASRPAAAPAWQQQSAPEEQPVVDAPAPRGPVFRGKSDDEVVTETVTVEAEERSEPLSLPSPESLGVGCGCDKCECSPCKCQAPRDWADLHERLEQLGALSFHQQKLSEGGYRVSFLMPTGRENRSQHVEATAETALQAAGLALNRAEVLARRQ
jgi:hypothetical protein